VEDLQGFWDKLCSVNWVERRHKAEAAIAEKAEPIWRDLCTAVVQSVESFNRLYRSGEDNAVEHHAAKNQVSVSLALPTSGRMQVELVKHARAVITLHCGNQPAIDCTYENVTGLSPIRIDFSVDDGTVSINSSSKRLDPDDAARLLLEKFLFRLPRR
jgi:hypothetical protein